MAFDNGIIDLRSDTVTRPTLEMRRAMYDAEVGDDFWGDDYTVKRLEEKAAQLFNREAVIKELLSLGALEVAVKSVVIGMETGVPSPEVTFNDRDERQPIIEALRRVGIVAIEVG